MLNKDYSAEILGLQGVRVKNAVQGETKTEIRIEEEKKAAICPECGCIVTTVHDYRVQKISDAPSFGKQTVLYLRKVRYRCACGKRFYAPNSFLPRYHRMTRRLVEYILNKLTDERSFTSVARETSLSVSTVIRVFDHISYGKPDELPEAVGIDEFKGNTNGEKFQCILTDLKSKRILDILPKRHEHYLCDYFKKMPRGKVGCMVSDMCKAYSEIAKTYFKNSTYVIDKYHWIRQCIWAFETVRKQEQKRFSKSYRIYFKHSRQLLLKRSSFLSDEEKQQVNVMLYASAALSTGHFLKELFLDILDCKNRSEAKIKLVRWVENASDSGIPAFQKCAATMRRWMTGILNSFDCSYTNGFTEGCNNKIKVLKRNAYGYRNFKRFRNRILHIFSAQRVA